MPTSLVLMLLMAQATLPETRPAPGAGAQAGAQREVQEGAVELECRLLRDRRVSDCVILSETPPGQGFGAAALSAARHARLTPQNVYSSAANGRVRFRTTFRLP